MKLKKGSAKAKAWGLKMKRLRNKSASVNSVNTNKKGGLKMRKKTKSVKRKGFKKSSSSNGLDLMIDLGLPVVYGYGREFVNDKLEPITSKIPMGVLADEVVLGGLAYLGYKKLKNPKVKKAMKNILVIEAYNGGVTLKDFGFKAITGK